MLNTEMGMIDADHSEGPLAEYTAGKGWEDKFVLTFWSHLVGRYQGIDG